MSDLPEGLHRGDDGHVRCWWQGGDPQLAAYHDEEWGWPVRDDRHLFEKICLEGFQSGLSWLLILRKRDNFRRAFSNFELEAVAGFTEADVDRLLGDAGIVRHRRKIESTINNARRALELREEFGSLSSYVWGFQPPPRPGLLDQATLRTLGKTPESTDLARDLKRRGWSFVGPTTAYAFMQSMGLANDHIQGCEVGAAIRAG